MLKEKQKFRWGNLSIKWKFFFYFMIILVILLLTMWLVQFFWLENIYEHSRVEQARSSAKEISTQIEENQEYKKKIEELAESNGICIELMSEKGKQVYFATGLANCTLHDEYLIDYKICMNKVMAHEGELYFYYGLDLESKLVLNSLTIKDKNSEVISYDKEIFYEALYLSGKDTLVQAKNTKPVHSEAMLYVKQISDGDDELFLFINTPVSPRDSVVEIVRFEIILISLLMIVIAVLLSLIFSRRISKPIIDTTEAVKMLAVGDYNITFDSKGFKEINELSRYLTYTAEEFGRMEEMRKELVANVSHDLRAPLTLIKGYSELIRDFPEENPTASIQIIIDETKRLSALITEVLDVSALGSGVMDLNITNFDFTVCINSIVNRMQRFLKKEGYTIAFKYDRRVNVNADEKRIQQVFYNILINAVNFTGSDKAIEVRQTIEKDFVKIEVIDTGEGMDPEKAKHIWQRNYSGDKMKKRLSAGTGIGLFLVKSIVELLGGKCGTHSNGGSGTVMWFTVKLPDEEK